MDGDGWGLGQVVATQLRDLDPHVPRQHRIGKLKIFGISFCQVGRLELLCNLSQTNFILSLVWNWGESIINVIFFLPKASNIKFEIY